MTAKTCKAKTKQGTRCPNTAGASGYCFTHDPARKAERTAARKLGGLNRRRTAVTGEPVVIVTARDVLKLVNAVIADTHRLDNSPARARVMLAAADAAIEALKVGEFEDRLAAIESILKKGEHGNVAGQQD